MVLGRRELCATPPAKALGVGPPASIMAGIIRMIKKYL
jgi:hypothetical protein